LAALPMARSCLRCQGGALYRIMGHTGQNKVDTPLGDRSPRPPAPVPAKHGGHGEACRSGTRPARGISRQEEGQKTGQPLLASSALSGTGAATGTAAFDDERFDPSQSCTFVYRAPCIMVSIIFQKMYSARSMVLSAVAPSWLRPAGGGHVPVLMEWTRSSISLSFGMKW
jgi:hypothetical protein